MKADLEGIERALEGLRTELQPVLRPYWLPWSAGQENLFAVDELLRVGAELAHVGQMASDGLQCVVDAIEARRTGREGQEAQSISEALFAGLVAARPYFREAEEQVGRLYSDVAVLAADDLWSPLDSLVSTLEHYLRLGHAAFGAATAAPTLLGETEPVSYMILAQNNDELRATGGFISAIGLVSVERGKIGQLTIRDSYEYDKFTVAHPFAPEPMQRHMGIILWATRDGNWSPDFPTAVRDIEELYHLENPGTISGVLAFDMLAVQAMVKAIGPLELEQYDDRTDGDNVLHKMREYWSAPPGEWLKHRKDFIGVMASSLLEKLQTQTQPEQMSSLLQVLRHAIDEKHIQLYFHHPAIQNLLAMSGRDGALDRSSGQDYLLALDTNMGYNKVNVNVEKRIEYEVTLEKDNTPQATLTITYQNRSPAQAACVRFQQQSTNYEAWTQDCYWNYLRVYVPPGTQLLATEGVTETETLASQEGKTVFATFFVVPAGESLTVRFTYRLPTPVREEYRLLVQKQAGTDAVPLEVRIIIPPGVRVSSTDPQPQSVQQGTLFYELDLRRDRSLFVRLH
ncbi:MAG: DUF4012 domain-containing protein [Chloroflexi bacterium]|nr:DUF4012 domain-containing protein [Chloroflexota bacterium]